MTARVKLVHVAPFAGAWIEIIMIFNCSAEIEVAPFAGAWIEIGYNDGTRKACACRSLRGSVD